MLALSEKLNEHVVSCALGLERCQRWECLRSQVNTIPGKELGIVRRVNAGDLCKIHQSNIKLHELPLLGKWGFSFAAQVFPELATRLGVAKLVEGVPLNQAS
jgi:hypothetical protein